jgi:hypothetical protein
MSVYVGIESIRLRAIRTIWEQESIRILLGNSFYAWLGTFLANLYIFRNDSHIDNKVVIGAMFVFGYWIKNKRSNGMIGVTESCQKEYEIDLSNLVREEKDLVANDIEEVFANEIVSLWADFMEKTVFCLGVDQTVTPQWPKPSGRTVNRKENVP